MNKDSDIETVEVEEVVVSGDVKKDVLTETIRFQWAKGENAGMIETFVEEKEAAGIVWVCFESKRRCNRDLISEMMIELKDGVQPLPIDVDMQAGVSIIEGLSVDENSSTVQRQPSISVSPLRSLLEKQSEKNSEKLNFDIKINLPKKNVYGILKDSWPDEVEDELIEMIMEKSEIVEIREQLRTGVSKFVKEYYRKKVKDE